MPPIGCVELDWSQLAAALVAAIATAAAAAAKAHRPPDRRTRSTDQLEVGAQLGPADDLAGEPFAGLDVLRGYREPVRDGRIRRAARELRRP